MKKIILSTTLFLLVSVFYFQVLAQGTAKNGIYVHGNNASSTDWDLLSNYISSSRKLNTAVNSTQNTEYGVARYANSIKGSLTRNVSNRVIFGHSMGGVAIRHLDVNNRRDKYFDGVITVGAPLIGAKIANNVRNGSASNFIDKATSALIDGFNLMQSTDLIAEWIKCKHDVEEILEEIDSLRINALGYLPDINGQTTVDLSENSSYMNSYSNGTSTSTSTPKIHIYGDEYDPVSWNFLSDVTNETNLAGKVKAYAKKYRNLKRLYYTKMVFTFLRWGYNLRTAEAFGRGQAMLQDHFESDWNALIGAVDEYKYTVITYRRTGPSPRQLCRWEILDDVGPDGWRELRNCNRLSDVGSLSSHTISYNSPVNGKSDGFIPASSAVGFGTPWSSNATTIRAQGINHSSMMKDNRTMKDIYDNIFEGKEGVDVYFETPNKK